MKIPKDVLQFLASIADNPAAIRTLRHYVDTRADDEGLVEALRNLAAAMGR